MKTLPGVRTRRHRLLVGGDRSDAAGGETAILSRPVTGDRVTVDDTSNDWELHPPFGGWAGNASGRGRVGGRHIFEAMTQIRSVAIDVGRGAS